MGVDCLEELLVGKVICSTDLLHAETLAKLGYEGHRGLPSLRIVQFPLETVSVFYTRTNAWPVPLGKIL